MSERVAVITGGAGELGQALAAALRAENVQVEAPGRDELEVTDAESVRRYFESRPRLDLLINNAGRREDALCAQMAEAQWDAVLATNLRGAFFCAQKAGRQMMGQRAGHIINIGSFAGRNGAAGQTNYAAAKAGLIGLTQSLARELGRRNVRVNCVLPGFLETKFSAALTAAARDQIRQAHELGRFNTVAEAARFIVFLDSMTAVSGQVFQLDSRVSPWT